MYSSGLFFDGIEIFWDGENPMGKAEGSVADQLIDSVEDVGGLCEKIHMEGERGSPDFLITWPSGRMKLVETKSKDGVLSAYQLYDHRERSKRRSFVTVVNTLALVAQFMLLHRKEWENVELLS